MRVSISSKFLILISPLLRKKSISLLNSRITRIYQKGLTDISQLFFAKTGTRLHLQISILKKLSLIFLFTISDVQRIVILPNLF